MTRLLPAFFCFLTVVAFACAGRRTGCTECVDCKLRHCPLTEGDNPLLACAAKYFVENDDGEMEALDGNDCKCAYSGEPLAATLTKQQLIEKAKAAYATQSTCMKGSSQVMSGIHLNVGKCGSADQRVQAVYAEIDYDDNVMLIASNGIPSHCYHKGQPYYPVTPYPCEHYMVQVVPKQNQGKGTGEFDYKSCGGSACTITKTGGVCYTSGKMDGEENEACDNPVVGRSYAEDPFEGRCDGNARYHYHRVPSAIADFDNCGLIGYWTDGNPYHGYCTVKLADGAEMQLKPCYTKKEGVNGCDSAHYDFVLDKAGCNLDKANGITFTQDAVGLNNAAVTFKKGSYYYFGTKTYPFAPLGSYVVGAKERVQWCAITVE